MSNESRTHGKNRHGWVGRIPPEERIPRLDYALRGCLDHDEKRAKADMQLNRKGASERRRQRQKAAAAPAFNPARTHSHGSVTARVDMTLVKNLFQRHRNPETGMVITETKMQEMALSRGPELTQRTLDAFNSQWLELKHPRGGLQWNSEDRSWSFVATP